MTEATLLAIALGTLSRAVPLILAAMGGYTSERSGVINIALEGKMMIAISTGAFVAGAQHDAWIGALAGIGASITLALLHWLITQVYRVDHIISGMAINVIAFGASSYLMDPRIFDRHQERVPTLPVNLFIVLAVAIPVLLAIYSTRTRGGLRLQAVGSDPDKSRQMGVSPGTVRFWSLVATGVFCGLSGAMILANESGQASEGMTAGRGFIALAALIIGGWRPIYAAAACLFFAFFEALRVNSAWLDQHVPSAVTQSLPYLVTIIALAGFLGRNRTPAGLGKL
jgi:general nucleoside transport system permease protein